ncbi:MAG: MFS transporter [Gemmatimonadaceae bacterium]|nr:MFS transporter [Gemmatimonadaceae bacterium]
MSQTVRSRVSGATRGKLFILIVTNFVDMVGLLMILPLLPYYADELGGGGMEVALLVSSFTAAQLISAPLWGRFSDRHGRKPALLVGLAAAAIAYVVFAFATSLWVLLLSRIVQGAGGGTVGVIQAYVADSTEPQNRAKALGWLSAATNLGVALGPPLGSLALLLGRPGPGLVAATLCVLNIAFASRFLKESRDMTEASVKRPGASRQAIMRVVTHSREPAPRLIWIYAIAMGAFSGMTAILALFLLDEWAVGPDRIWMVFTYLGVISVITRAGILGTLVDRFGEVRLSRAGLVLLAIGLSAIPFAGNYVLLALAIALVPLGTAFTFPCVTSLLSRLIPSNERGLYMGVQQTFGGLARVIVPLWAGFAYDQLGHGVPFYTSALLITGTIFLGLGIDAGGGTKVAAAEPAAESAA